MPKRTHPLKPRLIFIGLVAALIMAFQLPRLMRSTAAEPPSAAGSFTPGLTLTFATLDGKTVDARDARLVSLMVPAGTSATSMLPAGRFVATWTGVIPSKIHDDYQFAALGRGDLVVTLNDQKVLDLHGTFDDQPPVTAAMHKGKIRLVVTYTAPADGDASVRLLWAAPEKILNPIPPEKFMHDPAEDVLARHESVRVGRDVMVTMRCAACHSGLTGSVAELKQDAPDLTGIGDRLNRTYLASWITNPRAIRPSTSMPRVMTDAPATSRPSVDPRAADIAAYLCPNPPAADTAPADPAVSAHGARLFTAMGCVACHVAPSIEDSDPGLNRVPLKFVRAEFAPGALAAFLKQPEAHYAWSKMPNFHLSDEEATALSAWLTESCPADVLPAGPAGDPVRGKTLFASAGCLSCHAAQGFTSPPPSAPDLAAADFSRGCSANGPKGVDYGFDDQKKSGLKAVAAIDWKPTLHRDPGPEFAAREMSILRCTACHSIDNNDSVWANLEGTGTEIAAIEKNLPPRQPGEIEGKGDQSRPPLTWTGEKLRPGWTADFIAGRVTYKPREWVYARMPSFPARATGLAAGMALTHGCPTTDEVLPAANADKATIGRTLTGQERFGCVKCHAEADQAAVAPFEAFAPNLDHVSDRIRHDYFSRWMNNPGYFLAGTKMPTFTQPGNKTSYVDIYNGDAPAEFDAIWNYLLAGQKIEPIQ